MFTKIVYTRGSISFINDHSYCYEFPAFHLRVEKLSQHVARVWFTNQQGNQIPVPPNTFLLDEDGSAHNDFAGSFFVTWIGRHSITHNGVVIFNTNNQKQVSVYSSCVHYEVRDALGRVRRRDGQAVAIVPAPEMEVVAVQAVLQQPHMEGEDDFQD